jgi:hypothetical protein
MPPARVAPAETIAGLFQILFRCPVTLLQRLDEACWQLRAPSRTALVTVAIQEYLRAGEYLRTRLTMPTVTADVPPQRAFSAMKTSFIYRCPRWLLGPLNRCALAAPSRTAFIISALEWYLGQQAISVVSGERPLTAASHRLRLLEQRRAVDRLSQLVADAERDAELVG